VFWGRLYKEFRSNHKIISFKPPFSQLHVAESPQLLKKLSTLYCHLSLFWAQIQVEFIWQKANQYITQFSEYPAASFQKTQHPYI
jgi:hypothetical protein